MFTNFTNPENLTQEVLLPQILNTSNMNITLIPSPERNAYDNDKFDFSIFDFTWTPVLYQNKTLRIKLNFTQPDEISSEDEFDEIQITVFEDNDKFFSPIINKTLHEDSRILKKKLPRQMTMTRLNSNLKATAQASDTGIKVMLLIQFGLNWILSGQMKYMFLLIRAL